MTEQLALTGTADNPNALGKPLTDRQQLAWDYVRARDGVTADEVGALLHSQLDRKRPHGAWTRCDFCARDGRSVLTSKALKPLVTYRNQHGGRVYVIRNPKDRVRAPEPRYEPTEEELQANPFAGLGTCSTDFEEATG